MDIITTIAELRMRLHCTGPIGFVPTMGNLHAGHLSLIGQSRALARTTVASIFVNRLQFLPHEDFDTYPRTFQDDVEALTQAGCDVLFAPQESELYPQAQTFRVRPADALAAKLEGAFRPGFFDGVCTVVTKLFNCVQPDIAVFGKKDYQQLRVIEEMVRQFALPVRVIAGEVARAGDGLALSSRNRYLSQAERAEAPSLQASLHAMAQGFAQGVPGTELEPQAREALVARGWAVDYLTVRRRSDLEPAASGDSAVVLGAARLGATRLIDALEVGSLSD